VKSRLATLRTKLGLESGAAREASAQEEPGRAQPDPGPPKPERANVRAVLDRLSDGALTYEQALSKIRALRGLGKR
jgi:hypothetical protein